VEERLVESADTLVEEAAGASEFRVRPELPERAQWTPLEVELTEERRRREVAEGERDELAARLVAPEGARGIPQRAAGKAEGGKTRPAAGGAPEAERPSWWRRR
jgi:hypothetical protein